MRSQGSSVSRNLVRVHQLSQGVTVCFLTKPTGGKGATTSGLLRYGSIELSSSGPVSSLQGCVIGVRAEPTHHQRPVIPTTILISPSTPFIGATIKPPTPVLPNEKYAPGTMSGPRSQ